MSKKTPSKKSTKKTVKNVIKDVTTATVDSAAIQADRNKYRSSAKFPKARTAGR